ncbi:MAG: hypothetical protein ACE5E7_17485 [Anaerolineae bacterium]
MDNRIAFRAAAAAAVIALSSVLVMAFGIPIPEAGIDLQPSVSFGPVSQFVYPTNTYPELALRLFTADSFFILGYLMVFAGLYMVTRAQVQIFAVLGLGAGMLTALFDALENAFFITYASLAANGVPLADPALPLIYIVANLKWMSAFVTLLAFGLVWPRDGWRGRGISAIMLLFAFTGVLGVLEPAWVPVRGLFFLVGMPLFAWDFWQRSRS